MPKIKTDYLTPSTIQAHVTRVHAYYSNRYSAQLPFDAEKLLETEYDMAVVPLAGLQRLKPEGFECSLSHDGRTILVDQEDYDNPVKSNRLNFTFAHELGHKVLHEKYLPYIDDITDKQFGWLEQQAGMFAAEFLMPEHIVLGVLASMIIDRMEAIVGNHLSIEMCADYQAGAMAVFFGVSEEAMRNRLANLNLVKVIDTPYISHEHLVALNEAAQRVRIADGKVWRTVEPFRVASS